MEGYALGIGEDGSLTVRLLDETITQIISGEISVRGMNGYV